MTTPVPLRPRPATAPHAPRFARWPVLPIVGLVALAHLAVAWVPGWYFDEGLQLVIGRDHLDWGSADQPPLTAALAALADAVAPGSLLVLRLPAIVATAAAVLVAALVARELGGDARAQTLTAAAQATGLWAALSGHWLTPYTLEPVQWLVLVWLLVRWQRIRDDRLLLLVGVVLGVAVQTKFQVGLLALAVLLGLLVLGPRDVLRRPLLWAGAAVAAVIAAPTVVWQAVNGWPQLRMGPVVSAEAGYLFGGRPGLAVVMLCSAGLMGTVLVAIGVYGLVRSPQLRDVRWLALAAVALYVFFLVVPGRLYYVAGLHGALAAAGALVLQRRREAGRRRGRVLAWPAAVLSAVAAAGVLAASVPTVAAMATAGEDIAGQTVRAYRALPDEQRARTVVMGGSYIYAEYIDLYTPPGALPPAYSTNRSYGWFAPPPEDRDTVLCVGDPGGLRTVFDDARQVASVGDGPDATPIWLLTGHREPWERTWPSLRTLTVS